MILMMVAAEEAAARARKMNAPDESLLARMAGGDAGALEELYTQTRVAVYGFALSIVRSAADAEDVMQEAYITLFTKAGSYRPMGKPMAWILTIVRNLALAKLHEAKRTAPLPEWEEADGRSLEGESLDRLVLRTALATLGDDERQMVLLHCAAGLKHREIAQLMGQPLGTVLSRYHRALAKLQKHLREETPE